MPGSTKIIGAKRNNFSWLIAQEKAVQFEKFIGQYLINEIATNNGDVKVFQTEQVKDYGKDFIIEARKSFEAFGVFIRKPITKETIKVFIEVKSTSQERLSEAFLVDIPQNFESSVDYYILTTNATITPYYQYIAQQNWKKKKVDFVLIDKFLLKSAIEKSKIKKEFSEHIGLPNFQERNSTGDISIEYQVERKYFSDNREVEVYFSLRNYSNVAKPISLKLASDQSWAISYAEIDKIIESGKLETFRVTCERILFDGPADLRLIIETDNTHETVLINESNLKFAFDPPFIGKSHEFTRNRIVALAQKNKGLSIVSITGEAGIGKSRTIEEAGRIIKGTKYNFFRYYFSENSNTLDFKESLKSRGVDITLVSHEEKIENYLKQFLNEYDPFLDQWIIVFEDLHHASKEIMKVFKEFVVNPPKKKNSIIIILTGRNDFTFPNEEYFSLLQVIETIESPIIENWEIKQFAGKESEDLIRQLIFNAPESAIEKILNLCQNNPFLIIELVQYLLDSGLAQLLTRKYIGILNVERFSAEDSLPNSIEDLYLKRLNNLKISNSGQDAFEFLIITSFFGFEIPDKIVNLLLDGKEEETILKILFERRFIKRDTSCDKLNFAHENLLYFIKRYVRFLENRMWCAKLLFSNPALTKYLSNFEKGELYTFNTQYNLAFPLFQDIWSRIQKISNFSSEQIDKSYFPFLDSLFECAIRTKKGKPETVKIILAKAYMGIHNFPLLLGQKACVQAMEMIVVLFRKKTEQNEYSLSIKQLQAHGLQNMGRTDEALQLMLEIESELKITQRKDPNLEFDLYDRFQEYYRKINHLELSINYGRLALNAAEKAKDDKLLTCHLITESGVKLFMGESIASEAAQKAYEHAKLIGVERLEIFTYLTTLVVKSMYNYSDKSILEDVYNESKKLLLFAAKNNLSDSIMRVQLLLATISPHCFEDQEYSLKIAMNYIDSGQSNSLRFGNGLFDWAFDNLAGIMEYQNKSNMNLIRMRFQTCHERLKRRGLLFLGAKDSIYPNYLAISNIIRFFGELSESAGLGYISSLDAYNNDFLFTEKTKREILQNVMKGKSIFLESNKKLDLTLRLPFSKGFYTPLF